MKKFLILISIVLSLTATQAYMVNGKYFSLEKCEWGQMGYKWGNIGYYKAGDGERVRVFFETGYCEY